MTCYRDLPTGGYLETFVIMQDIPPETLKTILDLRRENGLEATEAAARKDMSKAKWQLTAAPRYRQAGRSPLFISGKYLSSTGKDPITGESDEATSSQPVPTGRPSTASRGKIDELMFFKVLHGKGFQVKHTTNSLTGETEKGLPPQLSKLNLQFSAIPSSATGIHVTQTTPQIQVSMSLDKFLEIAALKP